MYFFKVEITGTSAGPRDPSFNVPSEIVVGETATITGPAGLEFTATVKSGSSVVSIEEATITALAEGDAVITVASEAVESTWNDFSQDYNVTVVAEPEGPLFSWTPKTGLSNTDINKGTYTLPGDWLDSVTGGTAEMVVPSNGNMRIRGSQLAYNSNNSYFHITLSKELVAGDQIDINSSGNTNDLWFSLTSTRPSSAQNATAVIVQGTTYTIGGSNDLVGKKEFYVWRSSGTTQLGEFTITRPAPTTDPVLVGADASIGSTTSGVEATKDVAVAGTNLTGATLTATLSPAVTGLTVTLGSSAIVDGEISTTATLHYTATANAKGETTLTLSDGETSVDYTVSYAALVVKRSLQSVSTATTWDWSAESSWNMDGTAPNLSASTTPSSNDELTYSDFADFFGFTLPSAENFNADAITFKGQYPVRKNTAQAGALKINVEVPGTLAVTFSDTGTSGDAVERYLRINEVNTEYYTKRTGSGNDKKTVTVNLEAGENVIDGSSAICVYKLVFTPAPESESVTVAASGWTSLASALPLDFANAEDASSNKNLKAYVISNITSSAVTLTSVESAPAETGLILKGTASTAYTIPVSASPEAISKNELSAAVTATAVETESVYVVSGGELKLFTGNEIPAGKAYLQKSKVDAVGARSLSFIFDDETTGISNVENSQRQLLEGDFYNLAGQRVAAPAKGLYIVNGRKVVIK
ncbi:MAG: hypothetical protein IJ155_01610 [Prevotella sp.]|nr:hypothetical protein [Prevotella sp.]